MRYIDKPKYSELALEAKLILKKVHYNESPRLKEILRQVYGDCCVYCQSSPESGSFGHIEHFYPKNVAKGYDHLKDVYQNLHLACQRCNTLKGDTLPHGIFSANYFLSGANWRVSDPGKFGREMVYYGHLVFTTLVSLGGIDRARNTISLFDLNNQKVKPGLSTRRHLVEARLRIFSTVRDLLDAIYLLLKYYHPSIDSAIQILIEQAISYTESIRPYSVMVLDNFAGDILNLYEIYFLVKTVI